MARRSNQKLKLMYLSKILIGQTDERRGLTLTEIAEELSKYGIEAGRKSLYDDMEALRVYGLDVKTKRDRYVKYYVSGGSFDKTELKIIADVVASSNLLTKRRTDAVIKKLTELGLSDYSYDDSVPKALTEDAYNNIGLICKAIALEKKLTFRSFEWNSRKQRILCADGEYYLVSPYKLIHKNGKYLLLAYDHTNRSEAIFYIDRLLDVSVSNRKRDLSCYNVSFGCVDEAVNVQLRCENSVAGNIFEKLGTAVTVLSNREDFFEVSAKVVANEEFFAWVFAQGGNVKILNPPDVSHCYEKMLLDNIRVARNEKK